MDGIVIVIVGVVTIIAIYRKWSWFVEFPQCRSMRERYGEAGFALYAYAMCCMVIIGGLYIFIRGG